MTYSMIMDFNGYKIFPLVSMVIFICLMLGCKDCDPIPFKNFSATFSLLPEKREYKVGDSIIFKSEILKSNIFPEGVNLSEVDLSSQISTGQLLITENGYKHAAAHKFKHLILKGLQYPLTPVDSTRLLEWNLANFIYEEINGKYIAEILTIPQDTGSYIFSPFSGIFALNKGESCEEFNVFEIKYINGNTNIDILEGFDHNSYDELNKRNHYVFIVKPK